MVKGGLTGCGLRGSSLVSVPLIVNPLITNKTSLFLSRLVCCFTVKESQMGSNKIVEEATGIHQIMCGLTNPATC